MEKPSTPAYNLDVAEALKAYHTSRHGLSAYEAEHRLLQFGPNALPARHTPLWRRLIEPFASVFVGVLIFALVLSLVDGHITDAVIIAVIVGINAVIYYVQQASVSRALQTLRSHDITLTHVIRDNKTVPIQSEQLTYGDIVHINEGMKVPVDGRIIEAAGLECDEAILTGESLPVHKHAAGITGDSPVYNQRNMAFKGTYVRSGNGLLLVTGVGTDTQLGEIIELAAEADVGKSPIEHKIDSLIRRLIIIIGAVAAIVLLLDLYRGAAFDEGLRFALIIIVSAIPEGLPIALTVVLLLSARRMAHLNALVKKMSSIETMGAITLIATDKTGTITENKLDVADKHSTHPTVSTFDQVILASLNQTGDHASDSLDAILATSVSHAQLPASWQKVRDFPFDQDIRMSGVLWRRERDFILIVKGAPESVLEHCLLRHKNDTATKNALNTFTSNGYRTIAFAHTTFSHIPKHLDHHTLTNLGFDGFAGMSDKIRPKVDEAVAEANRAGIKVVMLTGDHVTTAGFIAQKVGISKGNDILDSTVLQSGNTSDILESLEKTHVFGRVLPEHKYALLKATKNHEITAMTGDGVNDIPALLEADAGIAMGSSSDAAKDASDMILLDNNFHTIVAAVRIGRTTLANIRKMVIYLLGTSLGEVLTMILALIAGLPLPVVAVQILWINLVTDGAAVIPLGLSPAEERQMLVPPRSPGMPLLSFRQLSRVILVGLTMSATVLAIYKLSLPKGHEYAQTLAFLSLIVVQWANALNANFEFKSWIYNFIRPNYKLLAALLASVVLQLFVFLTPFGPLLNVVPVEPADTAIAIVVPAIIVLLVVDAHKLVFRYIRKHHRSV